MASKNVNKKLEDAVGQSLDATGEEPPRLVRANSAFAKPTEESE